MDVSIRRKTYIQPGHPIDQKWLFFIFKIFFGGMNVADSDPDSNPDSDLNFGISKFVLFLPPIDTSTKYISP